MFLHFWKESRVRHDFTPPDLNLGPGIKRFGRDWASVPDVEGVCSLFKTNTKCNKVGFMKRVVVLVCRDK